MSTNDLTEEKITDFVLDTLKQTPAIRTKQIMEALVRHLHAFIREIEPSEAEWMTGVKFLTATGKMCSDVRQEFILLSDTLGVTTLIDAINHRYPSGATANSVLGPFYLENLPTVPSGSDISGGTPGTPMYFAGRILDARDTPVSGAAVDIWHADGDGHYDVMRPGRRDGETAMRALMRTDEEGRFWFRSVLPTSYPIPDDGPVGAMMRATGRNSIRPAHVHIRVDAPGFQRLTTMLFVDGDAHIASDPVFGVKDGLIHQFELTPAGIMPDGIGSDVPYYSVDFDFRLAPLVKAKSNA
jgi:hydroxyquinol 1,2-dioxygenase